MADEPLSGWKQIARYLGVSVRSAQVWAVSAGLPVHKPRRRHVYAYSAELDEWVKSERTVSAPVNG